jgi:hypothetical protein
MIAMTVLMHRGLCKDCVHCTRDAVDLVDSGEARCEASLQKREVRADTTLETRKKTSLQALGEDRGEANGSVGAGLGSVTPIPLVDRVDVSKTERGGGVAVVHKSGEEAGEGFPKSIASLLEKGRRDVIRASIRSDIEFAAYLFHFSSSDVKV